MEKTALNVEFIATALERGSLDINDPILLKVLEQSLGKPIKPRNKMDPTKMDPEYLMRVMAETVNNSVSAPKGNVVVSQEGKNVSMPVIKTDLPGWMSRKLSKEEMYKMAVEETDKKIMGSHILQNKDFGTDLRLAIEKWATPELFDYLSMKGPRAEAELRAAMYPLNVGFCHRIFEADGRQWMVPYITIGATNSKIVDANKGKDDIKDCPTSYSFYCNKMKEVHCIPGDIVEKYSESDYRDFEKMRKKSIKDYLKMDGVELRVPFIQPKTGERQYGLISLRGSEGWQERHRFGHSYDWVKWRDITDFYNNGDTDYDGYWGRLPDEELIRIEKAGREAIANIQKEMMKEDGMLAHRFTRKYDDASGKGYEYVRDEYYREGDEMEWEQA